MAQWGQPPGFQYPLQTGFQGVNPQVLQQSAQFQAQNPQLQQGFGFAPQQTRFLGSQQTGYVNPSGFLQAQPTGFVGGIPQQQQQARPSLIPPVPPIPSQFQQQSQTSSLLGLSQQQPSANRFIPPSPNTLSAQPTFLGRSNGGPLVPAITGVVDPRLQMMSTTFMPVNLSSPYTAGGVPQLPQQQFPGGLSLQQSFQRHNEERRGTSTPTVSWTLTRSEKKNYDNIFRAWDTQGTGYISGQTALEVFEQSGLSKQELADIWHLADIDNKGKLNMAEFHVAMGLIFRRLNGSEIPAQLPLEMIPPSARDLDSSVDFVKRVLENESRSRSPSNLDAPISRLKERSFTSGSPSVTGRGGRQDATVYKHTDIEPVGGFYTPASRRVDRDTVRSRNEEDSPAADLLDMKRQLENTAKILDRAAATEASRTQEDEALDREMQDLKYRVNRVQEDLEYASRGSRSAARDEERRRLERELVDLMHNRVPEIERKIEDRERRREREKRQWEDARNKRNERYGRYDDREERYSSPSGQYGRDRDDRDREYSRGSYSRDDRQELPRRDRSRDREYDRPRSPPQTRSPAPPPPSVAPASTLPPPAAPRHTPSPAPNTKNMTPEERQAYLRAEAKRRIDARTQALGLTPSVSAASVDTSVEERLAQEKKEAEEKARQAEKQAAERERLRNERLEAEKALKDGKATPTPTATANPVPAPQPTPTARPAAPVVKARAPPPPLPKKAPATRPSVVAKPSAPPVSNRALPVPVAAAAQPVPKASVIPPVEPRIDPEEEKLRAREEALRKQREARVKRLRQLEQEEEEARQEEEQYRARKQALLNVKTQSPVNTAPPAIPKVAEEPVAPVQPTVLPTTPMTSPAVDKSSKNPFSRFMKDGAGSQSSDTTPPVAESKNPFPKTFTAPPAAPSPPSVPPPSKSPAPAPIKTSYQTVPGDSDDDWDRIEEKHEDDSSDDEFRSSRDTRSKIAQQFFGNIIPSKPQSTAETTITPSKPTVVPAAPAAPPPPSAPSAPPAPVAIAPPAPVLLPPAPPAAPAAPSAPSPVVGDVSALMSSIQAGLKLRKTQTSDRSGPPITGRVLGDQASPPHINAAPRPASPPAEVASEAPPAAIPMTSEGSLSSHRQSVDWYAGLAADQSPLTPLPSMAEEDEKDEPDASEQNFESSIPQIQVDEPVGDTPDNTLADVDETIEHRVLTLYTYEADKAEDLSFEENQIVIARPSKSGSDWWYGTSLRYGRSGFFPRTYVQIVQSVAARALYSYAGNNSDELTFTEGDEISIVDASGTNWWKAEQNGSVFLVPSSYVEVIEAAGLKLTSTPALDRQNRVMPVEPVLEPEGDLGYHDDDVSSEFSDDPDVEELDDGDKAEHMAREEKERQMVLQAAGLKVTQETEQPPTVVRQRSTRKRRPPPPTPQRLSILNSPITKDLPPIPDPYPQDVAGRVDDAFERYEAFRLTHSNVNRLSVASIETGPPSPGSSPTVQQSPSRENEIRGKALLQFLGRKTPASEQERRSTPVISGPLRISSAPPTREHSPAFGTSWASLVDKTVLDDVPSEERRRQETIFELIVTEAAYVRDLQLIVEVFYSSIMPLLDQKSMKVIFANVEDILLVNTAFLSALEERQKECRLYVDNIGDILQKHMPNIVVYMEYCVNQATAIKMLQSLRESNIALSSHLQRLRDDPSLRNLDLSSYLLAPMQRITKYPLLIRQILNQHTEMANDQNDIRTALNTAEGILDEINESIREQEGRERLKEVSKHLWIGQGRLDLLADTRYMGPRKLLKEGMVSKAKSGRKLCVFMCNDIIVLTNDVAKSLYRMPINLADIRVRDVTSGFVGKDDQCFEIASDDGTETVLRAPSARERQVWVELITHASKRCQKARRRALQKS